MTAFSGWKGTLVGLTAAFTSLVVSAGDVVVPPAHAPTLRGPITTESVNAILHALAEPSQRRQRWIVVSSPGGDVVEALRLAEFMHRRGLSVYVDGLCASSCANYLFTAGKRKVIGAGALVGWHGSPASEHIDGLETLDAEQRRAFDKSRRQMIDREHRLMTELGIDRRLLCAGDRTIERVGALGWTMPVASMSKFGLKDVTLAGVAPIPTRLPNHPEPIIVIDPDPDCERTYPPISATHY